MFSEMNQWQNLCISIRSSWLTSTFFLAYLLPLCFLIVREMLISPTISVFLSISHSLVQGCEVYPVAMTVTTFPCLKEWIHSSFISFAMLSSEYSFVYFSPV